MPNLPIMNIGGQNYTIKDGEARDQISLLNSVVKIVPNIVPYCTKNACTYDNETGECEITSGVHANFFGLENGKTYRIVINGNFNGVGTIENLNATWTQYISKGSFVKRGDYYCADLTVANVDYWFVVESTEGHFLLAIYDITAMDQETAGKLDRVYSPLFSVINEKVDVVSDDFYSFIENALYIKNIVPEFLLNNFTYDKYTGAFEITNPSNIFLNMGGMIFGHTYRIVTKGSFRSLCGFRENLSATWATAYSIDSFENDGSYYYKDIVCGYSDYYFTITQQVQYSDMVAFAIYDVTGFTQEVRDRLTRIYTPSYITSLKEEANSEINEIIVVGDSLTQGGQYANVLASEITDGKVVSSYGQGGIDAASMIAVQGGNPIYVEPFTIPATTEAVEVQLFSDRYDYSDSALGIQSTQGINPVSINGVIGNISATYDEGYTNRHYYFTRASGGEQVVIPRPCQVITSLSGHTNSILVIWLGTNDSYNKTSEDVEALADRLYYNIMNAVSHNGNEQYIVMGLTSKAYMSAVADENTALAERFGNHFLDIRKYLIEYGLEDAGITPTAQDETDISNGEIPSSLRTDAVHLNSAGYSVVGHRLYKKGVWLGYWK